MISRIRKSLSSKLGLSILLLAIPIFVLSLGILFEQSRNNIKKEATQLATEVLSNTTQRVCRHLYTVETATNSNDWLAGLYLDADSLLSLTRRIVALNPHIDGCSVSTEPFTFPKLGRCFSAYSVREGDSARQSPADSVVTVIEEEYDYFEKLWYKKPHTLGKPCWVVFSDDADTLQLTLDGMIASYCKPLYGADSRFLGVISTDLSLLRLSRIITAEKPYPNSYFVMIDSDGSYFIHPDPSKLFTQTMFSGADPARDARRFALAHEMTQGNHGSMAVTIDGADCLVCYQPVPGTSWSLALICPDRDILHHYHRLTYIVLALLAIGLVAILLLSRRAVAQATKPIRELLEKTQIIASGNYEVHIRKSTRYDAVGHLQNSFAVMLRSLNFHMGSVRYTVEQTERRNKELSEATRLAEEADKQKTAFIQNVTHQIRTPLNIIMGFAQVIRDYNVLMPEDEMKSITETMMHNTLLLNRMVLMLYDSSSTGISEELKMLNKENVSCNRVARQSIGHTAKHFPQLSIDFQTELPDDFTIPSNSLYLMRSLREILYNAAKYSDGQHVSLHICQTATTVRFIVTDTGRGIAAADRDLIFEPFIKVDDLSEGLGLGLPLSKRHIQNLGGDLTLDTNYHDGCRFIIELPKHGS